MGNCLGARVQSAVTPPNSGAPAAAVCSHGSSGGVALSRKTSEAVLLENVGSQDLRPCHTPSGGGTQQLYAFSYANLKTATRNFRPDSLLGEGGFGSVFKGHIDEHTFAPTRPGQGLLIAVKKLNLEGLQGHKEWLAELYFLGELHHPNLVKLIGYCAEEEHRLLVYEFLSRGSLENHLFGRNRHTLSWATRLKIASDAARGLTFLHDAARPVIYRDFKTSNILLDSDFNAKLSDFGLAKDGPTGDKTHVTTRVMGTYGYAAPEYVATGRLTAKSDVYGFGVVLLEILTGRRAVDKNRAGGEQNLVEWATPYLTDKRKWSRVLDQKLDGQYSLKGAEKAASLALECLNQDAKLRPTMKQVLQSLESILGPKDLSKLSSTTNTSSSKPTPRPLHLNPSQVPNFNSRTPKQDHIRNVHTTPKKEHKLVDPPATAFKLPSPKLGFGRQGIPSASPTRGNIPYASPTRGHVPSASPTRASPRL